MVGESADAVPELQRPAHLDDRYGGVGPVSSHDGKTVQAVPVSTSVEVTERVRPGVAVDEHGVPAPAEGPTIQVGGTEQYEARCRRCHEVPLVDRGQGELLG